MLDLPTAVELSLLPGALGAFLLRRFRERQSPHTPRLPAQFSLEEELSAAVPAGRRQALLAFVRRAAPPLVDDLAAGRRHGVVYGAGAYPDLLGRIADPPPLLWLSGEPAPLSRPAVAIVGSRAASPTSVEVAHVIARDLAASGLVIVSGLARGVDAAAHHGALAAPGATVAVLGSGLDRPYPPEHGPLARQIAGAGGAVVSELAPGAGPRKDHFPRRNRVISGLSLGVVVVEASHRSGSLITARLALDEGRDVMAVPGCVLGERHRGVHALIRDGAPLVEGAADVLAVLGLAAGDAAAVSAHGERRPPDPVLGALSADEPLHLQQLVDVTGLDPADILQRLTAAELAGQVRRLPGGRFLRPSAAVVR
jgi:DNA processing protein